MCYSEPIASIGNGIKYFQLLKYLNPTCNFSESFLMVTTESTHPRQSLVYDRWELAASANWSVAGVPPLTTARIGIYQPTL